MMDYFKKNLGEDNLNLPLTLYHWLGSKMNEKYGLTENNAYPEDLNFISIDLDNFKDMEKLATIKIKIGARWLDDIVDNNKFRQDKIDGVEEDTEEDE